MSHHPIVSSRALHRRRLLGAGAATAAGAAIGVSARAAGAQSSSVAGTRYGVNYDTGTEWWGGDLTREMWSDAILAHEIDVIANQLNASAITLVGSDLDRLTAAATLAAEQGIEVWVQPRTIEGSMDDTRAKIVDTAKMLESLRADGATTILSLGYELSLYMVGVLDGDSYGARAVSLDRAYASDTLGDVGKKLDEFLADADKAAREVYEGSVTYSAGSWEWPYLDWSGFDYLSANHYRDSDNADYYVPALGQMKKMGPPVVISEFGLATYKGAADAGVRGGGIIDWDVDPAEIDGDYERSETEQAETLIELLDIFEEEELAGAFVYTFIEDLTYSDDPTFDLDMASFGIVKVMPEDQRGDDETDYWQPKEAFDALAERWSS
jgi:hypothetical protein